MPLIDLQTNLKNLRFGNDRPGYGSSGLPYIQTIMPDTPNATGTVQPIYRPGSTGGLDFPIRGGQLEFNLGTQSFTVSSRIDRSRIRKFFEDKPRGTAFIQKQVGLQLSNPKIETGNTLFGIPQGLPYPGLLENTRVYNLGANTLAQVGVSGTGFHANRAGLVPFNPFEKFYYSIVNAQNVNNQKASNRLYNLLGLKMTTGDPFANPANVPDINLVNTLGISLNRNLIYQYLGGPNSVYGIGTTTIARAVDTTKLVSSFAMNYDQLLQQKSNLNNPKPELQDFRKKINDAQGSVIFPNTWTKEQSVDYKFFVNKKDKLNLTYPFLFRNDQAPWEVYQDETQDLVKFVFEAISNDAPTYSTAIFFRAFLTAGITDTNSAQLNAFKYIGRGENFYTYQGFDRTIGFSFRVAAQSREELRPLYNKLNTLLGQVYPDYSPNQGIMRAPVVRVTVGDYLYRVPGFLESINLTVDNNTPWEINLENDQSGEIAQLPQVIDVTVSFKPIMDILPKRPSVTSTTTSRVNTEANTATDVETVTTNVAALIANVPKSSPNDPTTFIKPVYQQQTELGTRQATAQEASRLRNVNVPPPTPPRIPAVPNNIVIPTNR
jgi:hypothetical protein